MVIVRQIDSDGHHRRVIKCTATVIALTGVAALGDHVRNWRALLRVGLEAMDDPATIAAIEARGRTERPLADPEWIAEMELRIERKLGANKRGPKHRVGV
jgi:putative transposase